MTSVTASYDIVIRTALASEPHVLGVKIINRNKVSGG